MVMVDHSAVAQCPSTNSLSCPGPPSSSSSRSGFRSAQLGTEISTKDKVKGSRFGDIVLSTINYQLSTINFGTLVTLIGHNLGAALQMVPGPGSVCLWSHNRL